MATLSERWETTKPATFSNPTEYLRRVQLLDRDSSVELEGDDVLICFSDGSIYVLGKCK